MREVILQSPSHDKNIVIVENHSKIIKELPSDMTEVQARIKDILYGDKTRSFGQISKLITRQLELIENMYSELDFSKMESKKVDRIKKEYQQLVRNYGAKILSITRISKGSTESPYPLQNADFSVKTIKTLIKEGESRVMEILKNQLLYCVNYFHSKINLLSTKTGRYFYQKLLLLFNCYQ
jgi:NTE family protein